MSVCELEEFHLFLFEKAIASACVPMVTLVCAGAYVYGCVCACV